VVEQSIVTSLNGTHCWQVPEVALHHLSQLQQKWERSLFAPTVLSHALEGVFVDATAQGHLVDAVVVRLKADAQSVQRWIV
jgi:hypothetical protein